MSTDEILGRTKKLRLVAYLRVSTDKQVEQGMGLAVQEAAVKQWAKSQGHRIAATYRDEGISGSNGVDTRIGLHQALQAIQDGEADGLIIYKLDRLARALTIQEATLAQVWNNGGSVFTVDLGEVHKDDPDDPMRNAMRQMVGVFAQLERGMISARMRGGRTAKAQVGGYAYGSPAFGITSVDRELVQEPGEAETVSRIMELHNEEMSLREIISVLEAEQRPAKRGGRWHPKTVRSVIERHKQVDSAA